MTHRAEPHVNLRITESSLTNNLVMVQTRKTQQRNFQHFPAARLPQLGVDPRGKEKRRGIRVVKKVPIFGKVIFGPIFVIFRNEGQDFVHQSNSRFLFFKKNPRKADFPLFRGDLQMSADRGEDGVVLGMKKRQAYLESGVMNGLEAVEVAEGEIGGLGEENGSDFGVVADAGEMEKRAMLVVGGVGLGRERGRKGGYDFGH